MSAQAGEAPSPVGKRPCASPPGSVLLATVPARAAS
jgi:hypothetical protein